MRLETIKVVCLTNTGLFREIFLYLIFDALESLVKSAFGGLVFISSRVFNTFHLTCQTIHFYFSIFQTCIGIRYVWLQSLMRIIVGNIVSGICIQLVQSFLYIVQLGLISILDDSVLRVVFLYLLGKSVNEFLDGISCIFMFILDSLNFELFIQRFLLVSHLLLSIGISGFPCGGIVGPFLLGVVYLLFKTSLNLTGTQGNFVIVAKCL